MDYLISFEDSLTGHLSHHGVKGMKWGVWNAETKARYVNPKSDRYYTYTKRSGKKDDVAIRKGSEVHRISTSKKDEGDMRYVSADDKTRGFYKHIYGKELQNIVYGKKNMPVYEQTYEVVNDLKSPSLKKRTDYLNALMKDESVKDDYAKAILSNRLYISGSAKTIDEGKKKINALLEQNDKKTVDVYNDTKATIDREISTKNKYDVANMGVNAVAGSRAIREKYAEMVKKDGYNAILDDNGVWAGSARIGDTPMIALYPNRDLKQTSARKVDYKKDNMGIEVDRINADANTNYYRAGLAARSGKLYTKEAAPVVKEQMLDQKRRRQVRNARITYAAAVGTATVAALISANI